MITTELEDPVTTRPEEAEGVLTDEILTSLRHGYQMNVADRACHNAVTNNDTKSLALNRSAIRGDDGHFTHRIGIKGVTNQKKSGRCWIFAGLNVLRPRMLRDLRMEEFEFSTAYLQFWDKMEKSNLYLESIIELRDVDFLDRDWETVNKWTFEDGGWWSYLVGLVGKYGVMPLSAMPQTHASNNTETLNEVLGRLLRARAAAMMHKYSAGADVDELRSDKTKVLAEVYRLLVIHFGEPPLEFEWRYPVRNNQEKDGETDLNPDCSENRSLTTPERHTPYSFCQKYVSRPLGEFVCLYNDPHCEFNRHYRFDRARNIVGNECMDFVNIDSGRMKELAKASILANEPLWFAVNMGFDQSQELGLMKRRLYDYETLFGIDLSLSKADRTRFHAGASSHAMALIGMDLDENGGSRKWLVENSWGEEKGEKGLWTLHDDWFDEHVYTIIVHRRHVSDEILRYFDNEPIVLPAWYPGAAGSMSNRILP